MFLECLRAATGATAVSDVDCGSPHAPATRPFARVPVHPESVSPLTHAESQEDSFVESLGAYSEKKESKPRTKLSYLEQKKRALAPESYTQALQACTDVPCCANKCLTERITWVQFWETRRASYERKCQERFHWLEDRMAAALRVDHEGTRSFQFTVGTTLPTAVCEDAFFIVADFTGGSRTSAMAAWRAGTDRRKERFLKVPKIAHAPKSNEMLNWMHRYVEYRGHFMPHMAKNTVFIDHERRQTMYAMFRKYCQRQGLVDDNIGAKSTFRNIWNKHFLNRPKDDPRGQVTLRMRRSFLTSRQ